MDEQADLEGFLTSPEVLVTTFRDSPVAMSLTDMATNTILDVNQAFVDDSGWPREYFIGKKTSELNIWADLRQRAALLAVLQEAGEFHSQPAQFIRRNGEKRHVLTSGRFIQVLGRQCLLLHILDVTDRTLAENLLLENKTKFELLFNQSPLAMTVTRFDDGAIMDCNLAFERILGYSKEEILGKSALEVGHWSDLEARKRLVEQLHENRNLLGFEHTFVTKARVPVTMRCNSSLVEWSGTKAILTTLEDITEMRRVEERNRAIERSLLESRRLDSLGRLAGGVAHDFNNFLSAIIGQVELMKQVDNLPEAPGRRLEKITSASIRARDLIRKILQYSRPVTQPHQTLSLGTIVAESLSLLETQVPHHVSLRFTEPDEEILVEAEPSQIHEIILNLGTNALQALGSQPGAIQIDLVKRVGDGVPRAEIVFRDTGPGIAPEVLPNIFDPFFTTKPPGSGTGLGLSVVEGTIHGLGGSISLASTLGVGTAFTLTIPVVTEARGPGAPPEERLFGCGERVLVVDDEPLVLESTTGILEYLGYEVVAQATATGALEEFRRTERPFHLVLTDLTMPGMDGIELAQRLAALGSSVPVILVAGFITPESAEVLQQGCLAGFLPKPLKTADLSREIRRVLGAPPRA